MKRVVGPLLLVFMLGAAIPAAAEFGPEYGAELEIIFDKNKYQPKDDLQDFINHTIDREADRETTELRFLYESLEYKYFYDPAWSPDGKWIAFTGKTANGLWIVSSKGGELILIDNENSGDGFPVYFAHLGGCSVIADYTKQDYYKEGYRHLCFTPDGQEITYETTVFDISRGSVRTVDKFSTSKTNFIPSIESINIFTGEKRVVIEEGKDRCWSRDGRYLAYIHFDSRIYIDELQAEHNGDLAVYDTVTGETRFLTDNNYQTRYDRNEIRDPSFSPEGSHIAFIYNNQLCRIPFEGGEIEQLTHFEGNDKIYYKTTEYSNDSQWIMFAGSRTLLIYDTLSGESYYVFSGDKFVPSEFNYQSGIPIGSQELPKWSPDGSNLCYIMVKESTEGLASVKYMIQIADFDPDRYDTNKNAPILVESKKPSRFALRGNYPNPFNPSTTIEFTLPHSGFASLVIYNMTGQKVRELLSQYMTPGVHSVTWDGRGDNGFAVSSGVYISRLQMGTQITAKQMMLIR